MMEKQRLLVIFGGRSMEYYAACKAVAGLVDHIDREKFDVLQIGVTYEGEWMLTKATSQEIYDGESWTKRPDNRRAVITPERNRGTITVFDGDRCYEEKIDVIFPLICGYGGEDGRLQGLLDLSNIPYVGSGVAASANSMDKELTRLFADACGVKQPACVILTREQYEAAGRNAAPFITFDYPVYVKPATGGTSVGVSRVENESELAAAMDESFRHDDKTLIEQGITGTEIKVAVLETEHDLETGAICEIVMDPGTVNDYETKQNKSSEKHIPAHLGEQVEADILEQSKRVFRALGCRGFARVDFFLTPEKEIVFNEINTVPGLGKTSIYSVMFEKAGVPFTQLLTRLIGSAFWKQGN